MLYKRLNYYDKFVTPLAYYIIANNQSAISVAHADRILHHALVALHLAAPVELAAALLQASVHQQRVAAAAAHRRAAAAAGAGPIAAPTDGAYKNAPFGMVIFCIAVNTISC